MPDYSRKGTGITSRGARRNIKKEGHFVINRNHEKRNVVPLCEVDNISQAD